MPPESINQSRIVSINLPEDNSIIDAILSKRDRDIALKDLIDNSRFQPLEDRDGPYHIDLSIQENRLILAIKNRKRETLPALILSLRPYKRLIQDYFLIVQSYDEAIRDGRHGRIEAIDMGRRGLHNEGAELLAARLGDKITMDFDTARRLFTLICVLHEGKALLWR